MADSVSVPKHNRSPQILPFQSGLTQTGRHEPVLFLSKIPAGIRREFSCGVILLFRGQRFRQNEDIAYFYDCPSDGDHRLHTTFHQDH